MAPEILSECDFEHNYTEESRPLSEILEAIDLLVTQVWYNRHMIRREHMESGKTKLVEREAGAFVYGPNTIVRDIWEGALKAAAETEKKYGPENWPWTDFSVGND